MIYKEFQRKLRNLNHYTIFKFLLFVWCCTCYFNSWNWTYLESNTNVLINLVSHHTDESDNNICNQFVADTENESFPLSKYNINQMTNHDLFHCELLPTAFGKKSVPDPQHMMSQNECIDHFQSHPYLNNFLYGMVGLSLNNSSLPGFVLLYHPKTGSTFYHGMLQTIKQKLGLQSYNQRNIGIYRFFERNKEKMIDMFCNVEQKVSFPLITIVRDPMTRLLSGFLDKCTTLHATFINKSLDNAHGPCREYILETVGIDVEIGMSKLEYIQRKKEIDNTITFQSFIKWLNEFDNVSQENVDFHFRNYRFNGDLEFFHSKFHVFELHNQLIWYWIGRMILDTDQNSNLTQYWNDIYLQRFYSNNRPKHTNSDSNIHQHFRSNKVIYLALKWTFRDYLIFDINIPEWICNHPNDTNNTETNDIDFSVITHFLLNAFSNKTYLLPGCILNLPLLMVTMTEG